jgi:hypothetical protein
MKQFLTESYHAVRRENTTKKKTPNGGICLGQQRQHY